jgi:ketosteroid isomerase-like protein
MTTKEAAALLDEIELALESRDAAAAIRYYHDDVIYFGPAVVGPIKGATALRAVFETHFVGSQRTVSAFKDIAVRELGAGTFLVSCQVEAVQTILLSTRRFRGHLSRVFVPGPNHPLIILEHFTLA